MPATQTRTKSKGRNGLHTASVPVYMPPVGRPPRKAVDPVRKGLRDAFRTLKETVSRWEMFAQLDPLGKGMAVNVDGAEHTARSVGFLIADLEHVQKQMLASMRKAGKG